MREPNTAWAAPLAPVEDGWELEGRCRSEDPTLFFGPNRFEPKRERLAREAAAKAICAECPALVACREHAVLHGELYGVWGGMGETDRRSLIAAHEGTIARSA
ncbi:WhiB family transcriptional regulator [Nitriliruptoraceae bacterium ZYF776]|nr:WhiB family transcriptional regulator [Profundirhabdus halotolerans]